MAAYGDFGDLLALSERLRACGPARYTLAGVAVFLGGRAYQTTVAWKPAGESGSSRAGPLACGEGDKDAPLLGSGGEEESAPPSTSIPPGWRSRTGAFKAILIASLPCRSDQSVHGLAPGRGLADGRVSLILVGPCSRLAFLAFLISIPRTGILPGAFPAFVEVAEAEEVRVLPAGGRVGGWNCDGERLPVEAAAGGVGVRVVRGGAQVFARAE